MKILKARKITNKPLMLTGGFRSAKIMEQALIEDKLDIIQYLVNTQGMSRAEADEVISDLEADLVSTVGR